jgi:hypothetical protein
MDRFSVGAVLDGAFGLLRRHPGAVAIWCLIEAVAAATMMLVLRPMYRMQAVQGGAAAPASFAGLGSLLLAELLAFCVFAILMTAAFRAVLRPEERGIAFLRLGADELRIVALTLLFGVVAYLVLVISSVLSAIVGFLVGGRESIAAVLGAVLGGAGIAVLVCIWLQVRLALAFPLTLLRRRFVLAESWRLTRGRFWALLGALLVLFLILLVLFAATAAMTQGSYWSTLLSGGGFGADGVREASARQAAAQLAVSPMTVVGWVASGIAGGLMVALFGGATATAARLLADDTDRIAETFA